MEQLTDLKAILHSKRANIPPWAFICAKENATEQEFRQQCLQAFTDHKALEFMFDQVKTIALTTNWEGAHE